MYWFEFQKVSLILGETRQFLTPQRDSEVLIGLIAWVELTKEGQVINKYFRGNEKGATVGPR